MPEELSEGELAGFPLRLSVAVTTYRRPRHLEELLPLLVEQLRDASQNFWMPVRGEIVVVDNDMERSAHHVVTQHHEGTDVELRYVTEPQPGIAAARNRAMASARDSRILVFIDDDERPEPGWLIRLMETWVSSRAAAVAGPVFPQYVADPHPWIMAGGFYFVRRLETGVRIDVAGAGNLLLDLVEVRRRGVRFEEVGLAGGEDNLFTGRLSRSGALMVWCAEARVVERIPRDRTTLRWVLQRSWSDGNIASRTAIRLASRRGERQVQRLRAASYGMVRVAAGLLRAISGVLIVSPVHQARGLRTLFRGAGMVAGALGLTYQHYARRGEGSGGQL